MDEHANGAQPTAVLYLRVSTPSQVKTDYDPEGISIPAQRESCLRKAAQLGAQVVEEYIEPGRTATSMDKRPAFQAMLERIRTQRDVTYVIVYKLSRMNRNRLDDAFVLSRLRKYKATLVSATESIDETPVGQLMHGILAAFNEYRSAEDGADIRYKMGEKAKRGGTLGRARLGYTNIRERFEGREVRTVVVDPERAPYVSLAFEMYATGQYSFERLAEELTARGLRTRPGRYPAGPVSDSKLQTMLRDRYYLGVITYDGVEYPGRHPALVSQELFDQVQSVLDASGVSGERRRTHDHYLKGTIWCDRCREHGRRHRLIITKATGRRGVDYFYFLCRGRQERVCDLPHLPMEHVEEAVLRYWSTQRLSEDFIAHVRKNLRTVVEEMTTSLRLMSEQLTTELARIDRQEENLLDLAADGSLPSDKVRTRLTRLKAERKEIQGRLANSDDRLGSGATVLEMQLDLLEHPQELYRQLTDHGRRLLNQAVFYELFVEQDQEDLTIQVVGQTYTEPVRDLMLAARAYEQQLGDNGATNANRPALNGEPVRETLAGLLEPVFSDRGWSKTAMVELRGLEPLTPTLPVWCATSCATAPNPARQDRSVIVHTSRGPSRIAGTGGWWHSEAAAG
jgi:site-specific DNA recombinase